MRIPAFFVGAIALIAACAGHVAPPETAQPSLTSATRPNIVLVLFEDLSPRFGAYGDSLAQTPNFDRIASEGVLYTKVYTSSGVCAPSRAALITGRYQQTIGAQHMRTTSAAGLPPGGPQNYLAVPPESVKAFPELLRAAGYHTSNNSKTDYQFGEPFTVWDVSGDAADWSGRTQGQPFFHMRTLLTTHESAIWPIDMEPSSPIESFVVANNAKVFADRKALTDPAAVEVPPYLPDTPEVRRDIATHYDNIAFTDAALGALYDRLEQDGLLDTTILIISTDHGDGLPRMKRSLYDSGLHVPFVIRYPDGRGAGTVNDELVSFVDLAPTILSWAGLAPPDWIQGRDVAGPDRDPARDYVFAAQDRMDNELNWHRAARDERFKYIRNYLPDDPYFEPLSFRDSQPSMKALWAGLEAGTLPDAARRLFEPLAEDQLYDTEADPHEVNNLAGDPAYAAELLRLEGALDAWLADVGDLSRLPEAEMIETFWPSGIQPQTAAPDIAVRAESGARKVTLSCSTPGASIGYQTGDADGAWQLYTEPLQLDEGTSIRTKAIRYGFTESETIETVFD